MRQTKHAIALTLALLLARTAEAQCWFCIDRELAINWSPRELARTSRGIRVRLYERQSPYRIAEIYEAGGEWRHVLPADWAEAKNRPSQRALDEKKCIASIPYKPLDQKSAVALRPHLRVGHPALEQPRACITHDGKRWFGLGFYEGEWHDGVGGLGVYDPQRKRLEMRRPEWLRDKSISAIGVDGSTLWLGVWQEYEKSSSLHGLIRFDWDKNQMRPMRGGDAPCGFHVSDLLLDDRALWVATDLAVSRRDSVTGAWTHYLPSGNGTQMIQTSCRALYARILDANERLWRTKTCQPVCESDSPIELVARMDPDFARRHLMAQGPRWHWTAAKELGHLIDDVDVFIARVFERMPQDRAYDEARRQAVESFASRPHRDPRWRDFAIRWAGETGDFHVLRHFRGDETVFRFLAARLDREEAVEVLPWIDSKRAIPLLLALMNDIAPGATKGGRDDGLLRKAIEAIERAAHLRIEADGSRTPLAANSDTPEYADEEFGAFGRRRDQVAALQAIVQQWNAWARARK